MSCIAADNAGCSNLKGNKCTDAENVHLRLQKVVTSPFYAADTLGLRKLLLGSGFQALKGETEQRFARILQSASTAARVGAEARHSRASH